MHHCLNKISLLDLVSRLSILTGLDSFILSDELAPLPLTVDDHQLFHEYCLSCNGLSKVQNSTGSFTLKCEYGCRFIVSYIADENRTIAAVALGPFALSDTINCFNSKLIPIVSRDRVEAMKTTVEAYAALISKKQLITLKNDAFLKISTYIKTHIAEDLSADVLKAATLIPRNTLFRSVKDATSMSLGQYIKKVRLEYSARLLTSSDLSISQVSEMCGIFDCNYFSRIFREHYGLTPREFRKLNS